jgi:hypothetical protein
VRLLQLAAGVTVSPMSGDVMTIAMEAETATVLIGNLSDLHSNTGKIVRNAARGDLQRIDDGSAKVVACLVIGPQYIDSVLRFLGVDPDSLPAPGSARDVL